MKSKFATLLSAPFISTDYGLLILRITTSVLLFYKHGAEKIFTYQHMLSVFHDPHFIGNLDPLDIGRTYSLWIALFSDGICSVFVLLGLFTRITALIILCNIMVAFFFTFHAVNDDHGEIMLLYLAGMSLIFLMGPGKISLDNYFFNKND